MGRYLTRIRRWVGDRDWVPATVREIRTTSRAVQEMSPREREAWLQERRSRLWTVWRWDMEVQARWTLWGVAAFCILTGAAGLVVRQRLRDHINAGLLLLGGVLSVVGLPLRRRRIGRWLVGAGVMCIAVGMAILLVRSE